MSMLGDALIRLMADAAKAGAQVAAQQQPRKGSGKASSCTPCAAHAYVEKVKRQAGMKK